MSNLWINIRVGRWFFQISREWKFHIGRAGKWRPPYETFFEVYEFFGWVKP